MDTLLPTADIALDDLHRLYNSRHSCRSFRPDRVPRATLDAILQTAQMAASWSNTQPWQLHVVSGAPLEAVRGDMFARAGAGQPKAPEIPYPAHYPEPLDSRRRACGWGIYETLGIQRGDREASGRQARENFRFFGAPHVVLVTCEAEMGSYGLIDCGIWLGHFLTAATAAGVATCAQAAAITYPEIWRQHLAIAPSRRLVVGVAVGFAEPQAPANRFRSSRASLDQVIDWAG